MAKDDAYGTQLKIGTNQIETAVVVLDGTVSGGTTNWTLTANGMTGTGDAFNVTTVSADTASMVAARAVTVMNANANITALFSVVADGPNVVITRKVAAADDATLNLAYADNGGSGLADDSSSNATLAGAALATVAQVTNIGGPSLSLDTVDVTCHDSTSGFEEVVATLLRGGEVSLDIVYDPADDTHDATGGNGLITRMNAKRLTNFSLIFPNVATTTWAFDGYVTGFEPSMPVDGALTATVTIKTTGPMTLV